MLEIYPDAPNIQYGNLNIKGGGVKKRQTIQEEVRTPTTHWIGTAVKDVGDGHADIDAGDFDVGLYKNYGWIEINYWKFTKIEPKQLFFDDKEQCYVLPFKHILDSL